MRQADNESDRDMEQWSQVPLKIDISSRSVGCRTKDDKKPLRAATIVAVNKASCLLNEQIYIPREFLGINLFVEQF